MNEYTLHRIHKNRYGDSRPSTYWLFLTPNLLLYSHGQDRDWFFSTRSDEENIPKSSEDLFG